MTEGYNAIASVYDKFNAEIDYEKWADFVEAVFDRYLEKRPELVLDLACGTGRMTRELSRRGYDMIGVDGSEQMLSVACDGNYDEDLNKIYEILYLLQDMRSFELYGTVGAVVCCLDSVNYLTEDGDLEKTFRTVHNYLDPDGIFLFDVNSPYKFREIYGDNSYILEDEIDGRKVYCGWQNSFDEKTGICDFYLTLFSENEDGTYSRCEEEQREKMYTLEELKGTLETCGFEFVGAYSGYGFEAVDEKTERYYIAARAKK